jgi:hypothetical protein
MPNHKWIFCLGIALRQNLGYICVSDIIMHYLNVFLQWCFKFDRGLADPTCVPLMLSSCIQYVHGSIHACVKYMLFTSVFHI